MDHIRAKCRSNGSSSTAKFLLLKASLLLICLGTLFERPVRADDLPPDLDVMLGQFNSETGSTPPGTSLAEEDFGISSYDKSRTQFDGVTNEMQVTYLSLGLSHGVEIPVLSTGVLDTSIDFTIMLWFKIDESFFTKSIPGGEPPQIMYLLSFEDSAACFFTDTLTLMCDSWDRRKL